MFDPRTAALPLLLMASLSGGCAGTSKMAIRSMQPGRVHLGSTRHMIIVEGQGRRSAREFVNLELVQQSRARGYFSIEDRSDEGFEVRIVGRRVELQGGEPLGADEAGLRVDVLEWSSSRDMVEMRHVDPVTGYSYIDTVPVQRADVLLAVTLFNAKGQALLAETEYEGTYSTQDSQAPREVVIEQAASAAVAQLLNDITPTEVVNWVRLDEDDPGQEAIIKTAKLGNVAQAAQDVRGYLERNPYNAAAAYNLAVFLEAMGDFSDALAMYDEALALGNKDYYADARAQCARRIAATSALETSTATD